MMIVVRRHKPFLRDESDARCKTVPSPERIREICSQIRQTWSPRELERRAGLVNLVELLEMPLQPRRKGFWGE